jgi:hypothetical protein
MSDYKNGMSKEELLRTLDIAIEAETNIAVRFLLIYCRDYIKVH